MRLPFFLSLLLVASMAAAPGSAETSRTETSTYYGGATVITTAPFDCYFQLNLDVGGACFRVQSGETRIDVVVADDLDLPVAFGLYAYNAYGGSTGAGYACGSALDVALPSGTATVMVLPYDPALGTTFGGGVHAATTGTITATFR